MLIYLYSEITKDITALYHNPFAGSDLVMSHGSSSDLTFCKLDIPFLDAQVTFLHVTFPSNPRYPDVVRYNLDFNNLLLENHQN